MNHRADIDGLRAMAVLAVVFFHAFPGYAPGGFIGVDIFFVLSGFLISRILFEQMETGSVQWRAFYIKRIKRIFPALLLVLGSAAIAGYFLLFPAEYANLGKHIAGSASFINNFILWSEVGYFDRLGELKPLLHLWSLGIEEQFYLIWPLALFLIWKLRVNTFWMLVFFTVVSFALNIAWVHQHNVRAFYFPLSRFWELSLGGMLAFVAVKYKVSLEVFHKHHGLVLNLASSAALLFLAGGIFFYSDRLAYPGWAALLPTICTLILLFTHVSWVNRQLLSLNVITYIGLISYPLYLWHWELLSFARIIYSGTVPFKLTAIMVLLSFILAALTYRYIERPVRFSKVSEKYPRTMASALCSGLVLAGMTGFLIRSHQGFEARTMAYLHDVLLKDINGFDAFRKQALPCRIALNESDLKKMTWCLQSREGKPQKVMWGDSHAEHLFPGILAFDNDHNWLLLEQSGCPPLLHVASYWKGSKDKCEAANDVILKIITETPSIDTVVLASLGAFYISDDDYAPASQGDFAANRHYLEKDTAKTSKQAVFREGLSETIDALKKAGKKVVLFQDTPEIPFMPERCIHRPLAPQKTCSISREEVTARQKTYAAILETLKTQKDVLLFSPLDVVCNDRNCPLMMEQHLLYRDSHHLSLKGSALIAERFVPWLKRA
ncbi:acyltransferase [Legionella geestiana]|uniref:acyltransferase family protein n=1 Tax=Legionella geestiana TaxID=45065 RepID=UPI001092D7A4|nr:acyltransferase family protein [Legionella geestiana]QDQ40014.1 acyltransferase [Legionella geestiana]